MDYHIIVNGGLGNQMFQYALYLTLKERGHSIRLDTSLYNYVDTHNGYELERVFGIKEPLICRRGLHLIWLRLLMKGYLKPITTKDSFVYDKKVINSPRAYIIGYWQSEKYFAVIKDKVREVFAFRNIDNYNYSIAEEMNNCNSVGIHIRRGDYLTSGMTLVRDDYYRNAIRYIKEYVSSSVFYVFSDDQEEAISIMDSTNVPYKLITHNNGEDSYKDMFLMSQCKHNIICNSSFSWWGAWLGNYKAGIVVAPQEWVADRPELCPQLDEWIKI